jgi:hypothetical protein
MALSVQCSLFGPFLFCVVLNLIFAIRPLESLPLASPRVASALPINLKVVIESHGIMVNLWLMIFVRVQFHFSS